MDQINFYVSPSRLAEEAFEEKMFGVISARPHFKGRRYTHCCDATIENTVSPEDSILIGTGSYGDVSWPYGTGTVFDNPGITFLTMLNLHLTYSR